MTKQINFTIVPDDPDNPAEARRAYANFCAVAHTQCDLTLTFCEVSTLSERDIQNAETTKTVRAPVVTRVALPFGVIPGLSAALQEQMRVVQEAAAEAEPTAPWPKGPLH